MPFHFSERPHRPPWWPENEDWPPVQGRMRHNPLFRRLGCALFFFNLLGFGVFFLAAAWIANFLGLVRIPAGSIPWMVPLGAGLLFLVLAIIAMGVFGFRRVFNPLDDMLEAAGRVAGGDYSARVKERGMPGVRSLARAFNNMAARLYLEDERRRNFLADTTHELRTPLTVIQGNLEGMLDGVYPADEANLRMLLDETNLLAGLVEDLRTLALAESGTLRLKKEPTDLLMLIRDTLTAFQSKADATDVSLVVEALDDNFIPGNENALVVEIDPGRMRQVLANLVSNALRYSPVGGLVSVRYRLAPGRINLDVADQGSGIPPADLQHVFERYYKSGDLGGGTSSDSGGMGLGLAIVRHIVNAHGGSIEADSAPGHGTTMHITIPVS